MERYVEPELLDSLPEDVPESRRSRREITCLNRLMGNFRWFARQLPPRVLPSDQLLEVGSGTGELGLRLQKVLPYPGCGLAGLDLCSRPGFWPTEWDWHQEDALAFDRYDRYDIVIANLILHQFQSGELALLGQNLDRSTRLILASETARRPLHLAQLQVISPFLGQVSRHDAPVSVRAGFLDDELPRLLRLDPARWQWSCRTTTLGAYRMIAWRTQE